MVPTDTSRPPQGTLARAEWDHIQRTLAMVRGNVTQAAIRLGVYRSTLQRMLRRGPVMNDKHRHRAVADRRPDDWPDCVTILMNTYWRLVARSKRTGESIPAMIEAAIGNEHEWPEIAKRIRKRS